VPSYNFTHRQTQSVTGIWQWERSEDIITPGFEVNA